MLYKKAKTFHGQPCANVGWARIISNGIFVILTRFLFHLNIRKLNKIIFFLLEIEISWNRFINVPVRPPLE